MAARAAEEVLKRREKFRSLCNVYRHLLSRMTREGWPVYYAAVAAGLVGDIAMSRQLFQRLADWRTHGYEQQVKLKADGASLARFANDPEHFRTVIAGIIHDVRDRLRLPFDPELLRTLDSTAELNRLA
jgi:hypothetical protein